MLMRRLGYPCGRGLSRQSAGCTRVHVASGGGWVITERIRTVPADRFRRYAAEITLAAGELDEVRHVLAQMLIVSTRSSERPASQ